MPGEIKTIEGNEARFKMRKAMESQSDEVNRKSCLDLFTKNSKVEESSILQILDRVEKKMDDLEQKVNFIFKDHFLLDGKWCRVQSLKIKE